MNSVLPAFFSRRTLPFAVCLLTLICLFLHPVSTTLGKNRQDKKTYTLAIAPQNRPLLMFKAWQPAINDFNKQSQQQIELMFFKEKKEFEAYLLTGKADLVFGNAFYYLLARREHGYTPLVRSDAKPLKGIIVASKYSNHTISDLNEREVAFPSRNALAATLVIRSLLEQQGITVLPHYARTHQNAYLLVYRSLKVASTGTHRTLAEFKYKDELEIIYETPALPNHPLFAHPLVPFNFREELISYILKLDMTDQGKSLLKGIKLSNPARADHDRDYQELDAMDIIRFSSFGGN